MCVHNFLNHFYKLQYESSFLKGAPPATLIPGEWFVNFLLEATPWKCFMHHWTISPSTSSKVSLAISIKSFQIGVDPSSIYSCSIDHILEHEFCHLGCWAALWAVCEKFLKRRNFCLSITMVPLCRWGTHKIKINQELLLFKLKNFIYSSNIIPRGPMV